MDTSDGAGASVSSSSHHEGLDALLPPEMAQRAEAIGVTKVGLPVASTLVLAVLAGAFIGLGATFATVVGSGEGVPFGVSRLLVGVAFSLGLVLVIGAGAELFTGNALIVMAWAGRRVSTASLLRNWALVYVGNVIGAVTTAAIVVHSSHMELGGGAVGDTALGIARSKLEHGWLEAVLLGVLANALVCLAVWLSFSARTLIDKVVAVVFPITAFVAAGFEHSIANLYFVPAALFMTASDGLGYWTTTEMSAADYDDLGWVAFVSDNLIPVTIGNIVGGTILVALVYWFVYLRAAQSGTRSR